MVGTVMAMRGERGEGVAIALWVGGVPFGRGVVVVVIVFWLLGRCCDEDLYGFIACCIRGRKLPGFCYGIPPSNIYIYVCVYVMSGLFPITAKPRT